MAQASTAHKSEIEEGSVSLAVNLRNQPAWHSFANKVFNQTEAVTTAQMLDGAKLSNWNVSLEPVAELLPATYTSVSENFLVTRDDPYSDGTKNVLSVVGSRYKTVQNEDLFAFADNLHDGNPDVYWESAGSLKNGRVVYGSLAIPRTMILDPKGAADETKLYLIVWTSHDGSVAVQSAITPVRVMCQNTLNLAMKKAKQSFKIRHTQTVDGKIAAAREALGLTFSYFDEFEKQAQELFQIEVDNKKFSQIINTLYPKPEKDAKGSIKKWENKVVLLDDLYHNSPTNANIKGTAWGVVNALTERLDYYRTARKGSGESLMAGASGFDPVLTAEKNKIVKQVLALTK
ncbi:LGT_TIGR03299, phage/plasmid-like protein TIGR03299 [uncultured Caudovirales phage]|jgi:phage/plasmid-like protein (TIGR03299 family)|uniref:LGT_TIGR03299, phage/plasmid-like protein TIGR03299 n=1 Tax=uncultured Caudovirales phage TaxID=2100421 RepID=A0A6J5QLG4_9CAUD|nr:LGT_TIGR03299, phage/plasmid-like protein TIGR03299 [uncultured Caudovirales phage]CAB4193152.1 LGT_TIGR03299, phage/plasmid-like protein TIGR03299 [uncultured Caudovirales phage]